MKSNSQLATLEELTMQQTANNAEFGRYMREMARISLSFETRIKSLEVLLSQKITVSAAQAKAVSLAVQAQARALCDRYGMDYKRDGEAFRRAIWRDLKAQFGVKDIHDLPATYFELAISAAGKWNSFAFVRRLREKRDA